MMNELDNIDETTLTNRRKNPPAGGPAGRERRQFRDSRSHQDPEARELGEAIDLYKITNQRRFITMEEILSVIKSLGYHR